MSIIKLYNKINNYVNAMDFNLYKEISTGRFRFRNTSIKEKCKEVILF
jgi:hypothetical protein